MINKYLNSRYLGALIILPFITFLFLGGIYLKYFVLILSLAGMYELYKVIKFKSINPFSYVGYFLCLAFYLTLGKNIDYKFIFFAIIFSLLIMFCIPILDNKYNFIDISVTLLAFLYIAVFFSFIVLVDNKQYGNYYVWLIFISSWMCDTSAYYSGKFFGKTKLCPKISPKKTVEGSIGGLLGSTFSCGLFGAFIISQGAPVSLMHFIIIGIICGVFSQLGDLAASSIKRFVGVKDYGHLIPGHGGILDRFDSILFSGLVVFYYLTFVLNI
jgi:phosphatidate cytidylyltransferase